MSASAPLSFIRNRTNQFLSTYLLPLGWFALLTGMFWIGDRSDYHRLFYILLAAPTLLCIVLQPRLLRPLVANPMFIAFLAFSGYMMLTLLWSAPENSPGSLFKRPLYITLLLFCAGILCIHEPKRLKTTTRLAAIGAVLSAVVTLGQYYLEDANEPRLTGYGALYNPLLSAHVYGAFTALWLVYWMNSRNYLNSLSVISLVILGCLLYATGSRTPLIGLGFSMIWLLLASDDKRKSLTMMGIATMLIGSTYVLAPETVIQRGVSYRPEIWMDALHQISNHLWLGHGYDYPMRIILANGMSLADPHNIELGVLYAGGIVGLALWAILYGFALVFSWKNRHDPAMLLASTWLIFGFAAGLTEGNAFMSRPKEHWFLIWIPMTLIYAHWVRQKYVRGCR